MKTFLALAIALLFTCSVSAQTKRIPASRAHKTRWQRFAPAGLGFRIDVPSKPQRIRDLYGDTDPKGFKSIDVFGSRVYQIVVLVPSAAMLQETKGQNKLSGLEFTIGGDDAEPASESTINVNGLKGREFIYHFADAETPGHRRGRIIDARTRIFVLIYATKTASGLNSFAAVRFFNSFRVI